MAIQIEGAWTLRSCPEEKVVNLVRRLAISPWLARILVGRGVDTAEQAQSFLHPESQPYHDPFPLPGLDPFLQRIERAIRRKEKVVIHGDYDADGITSSAILAYALRRVGLDPVVFLPSRFEGGYGIQPEWVAAQKKAGVDLIVTTDCGSGALEAAQKAVEVGIDLIVTDHHTPNPDLQGPVAHVNPHLPDSEYPFRHLCGAGIALKLTQALVAFVPPSFQAECRRESPVDLAAIGTLADVMPLIDENRRIVVDGIDRIRTRPSPGVMALLESRRLRPGGNQLRNGGLSDCAAIECGGEAGFSSPCFRSPDRVRPGPRSGIGLGVGWSQQPAEETGCSGDTGSPRENQVRTPGRRSRACGQTLAPPVFSASSRRESWRRQGCLPSLPVMTEKSPMDPPGSRMVSTP